MKLILDDPAHPPALSRTTLVHASVSIGNVGQLSVDLLINTLRARRIGVLDCPLVAAISGPSGYAHTPGARAAPLEVYACGSLTIIQQRAPVLRGHLRSFAREIARFVAAQGIARVVHLTSSDAALRGDAAISGPQVSVLDATANLDGIHSAGVTRALVGELAGTECVVWVASVNEGDNVPDAIALLNAVNSAEHFVDGGKWLPPRSWEWLAPGRTPVEFFG